MGYWEKTEKRDDIWSLQLNIAWWRKLYYEDCDSILLLKDLIEGFQYEQIELNTYSLGRSARLSPFSVRRF